MTTAIPAIPGIPDTLTLEFARDWAVPRVSKKRGEHVLGVHKVGQKLARMAALDKDDQFIVELACLLHDACKEYKDSELVALAERHGHIPTVVERANGHLLHGPVAAYTVREELHLTNQVALDSITEHTLGNNPMSDISKLVFLADCLEDSRPKDYTRPIWQALEGQPTDEKKKKSAASDNQVNLDNAMLTALDLGLAHLLEARRAIHPKSVDVRNYFLGIVRASEK